MKNKVLDTIEGFFSILGLFAIISLSVLTVSALNPTEYVSENNNLQVQGVQIEKDKVGVPVKVNNLVEESDSITSELLTNQEDKYEIVVSFKNLEDLSKQIRLASLENSNDFNKKIIVSAATKSLVDKIKISLVDNIDEVILYSDKSSFERSLTINSKSERTMELKVEVIEKINYPFEVRIKFN